MAYSGAQSCIDRHIPYWEKYANELTFYSSKDSYPSSTHGHMLFQFGKSGHAGEHTIARHVLYFKHMLQSDADWYAINDYDSLILCDPLDLIKDREPCIMGNVFRTWGGKNGNTIGRLKLGHYYGKNIVDGCPKFYLHPPYIIHRSILDKITNSPVPFDVQGGYFDRWLGVSCEELQIPTVSFRRFKGLDFIERTHNGFSVNKIDDRFLHDVKKEHVAIHGIKDKKVLEYIRRLNP